MTTEDADQARADARSRPAIAPAIRPSAVLLALLGLFVVTVPALFFAGDTLPSRLDVRLQRVVDESPPMAWSFVLGVDWLGEPVGRGILTLTVALLCLLAGRWALAVTAVVGIVATGVVTTALKYVVDRRIHDDFLSYPSGHTGALTAAAIILALLLADLARAGPILGTALLLGLSIAGGGLMAWAQIDLTAHYPTDTIGGFGCALFTIPATALLIDLVRQRRTVRPAS